jgi:hypothetical protein
LFDNEDLPAGALQQARMLENAMLRACEGDLRWDVLYRTIRTIFLSDDALKHRLPSVVATCLDLSSFRDQIRLVSKQYKPRRQYVRDHMQPFFAYLEGRDVVPGDALASSVLTNFDADGVRIDWDKALSRRGHDPEGAITSARTLLETLCKQILDREGVPYTNKDDLPALYQRVAKNLNIAPSQHSEEAFKRILGGATTVVEGLGSLRNKIGDAHGKGGKPVRPTARHAALAVNLAGAMATFIIETWLVSKESASSSGAESYD